MFNQIYKVPATDMEALKSPLMGLFEKRRARNFFIYVQDYNEADPRTHQGLDLTRVTTRELIALVPLCLLHYTHFVASFVVTLRWTVPRFRLQKKKKNNILVNLDNPFRLMKVSYDLPLVSGCLINMILTVNFKIHCRHCLSLHLTYELNSL